MANGFGKLIGKSFLFEGNYVNGLKSGKGNLITLFLGTIKST